MHLHDGRVHLDGFDLDVHDLLPLQLLEDVIQHAILGPAIHAGIDGMPGLSITHNVSTDYGSQFNVGESG